MTAAGISAVRVWETARSALSRLRQELRNGALLPRLHAIFVGLVLLIPYQHIYSDFYYALLLIPFLIALDRQDWRSLARSWVLRFCVAYLAAFWLAALVTPELPASDLVHVGRRVLSNLAFAVLTAWLIANSCSHIERLCRWMVLATLMTALISLVIFYGAHRFGQRLAGWFWSNPNTAGAVFGLATVAAATAGLASGRSGWRIAYLAAAVILLACTALTGCRAALVAAAATGVVCALTARAWRLLAGVLGTAALLGVSIAAGWIGVDDWLARADSGRLELWAHFWSVGWQHPLFGEGMRQHLAFTISNGLTTDDPHNTLLYIFLRTGLVGAFAWVALMASAVLAAIRHWRHTGGPLPLALMLYLLAHGFFETAPPMDNPDWFWVYLWIPIGIAAGVGLAPGLSPSLE